MVDLPKPWFTASSTARRIAAALDDEPVRPLRAGERRLAGFILPPFQRPAVWAEAQKAALIESIWEGFPVGAYCVNRMPFLNGTDDLTCADWLLDGQQRWTAITEYVADGFPVYGAHWSDLSRLQRSEFRNSTIGEMETRLTDPAACRRIYDRLAYGGTAHEPPAPEDASALRR